MRYAFVLLLVGLGNASVVYADARHVRDYGYDAAGHATDVEEFTEEGAPQIESLSPSRLAIGTPRELRAEGLRLLGIEVSSPHSGLQVSAVRSGRTWVEFGLSASAEVAPGTYALSFTTVLGSTTRQVQVRAPVPRLGLEPFPVVLAEGERLQLAVSLSFADTEAHTVSLSLTGNGVASLASTQLQFSAGSRRVEVELSGLALGTERLTLSSAVLESLTVNVWVAPSAEFSAGEERRVDSRPVGVSKGEATPSLSQRLGPVYFRLGVRKGPVPVAPAPMPELYVEPVGVAYGPLLYEVRPPHLTGGLTSVLEAFGSGLGGVSLASLEPAEAGVTAVVEQAQADRVRLRVTVPQGEVSYPVRLRLWTTADEAVQSTPGGDRIRVNPGVALLHSVTPSRVLPGAVGMLTLRGERLLDVSRVEVVPGTGVHVGAVQAERLDGRLLSVDLALEEDTPIGPQVVRVHTLSGVSSAVEVPANTLQVIAGPAQDRTPVVSFSPLGVLVAQPPPVRSLELYAIPLGIQVALQAPAYTQQLYPAPLGVARPPLALSLSPPEGVQGSSVNLRIQGVGLETVQTVHLHPPEGVTPGTLSATPTELLLPLTIATDAAVGPRRILLSGADLSQVDFAPPQAGILHVVTTAVPQVRSLSPLSGRAGSSLELLVSGVHLAGASVQFSPDTGLSLGAVRVDADGLGLRVQLNLASDAPPGPRVLIVQTLTGRSPATPLSSNTFTVMPASAPDSQD